MKRLKEFLWFLIPFLSLSIVSVVYFILNTTNGGIYFKSMIADPLFVIALVNTFVPPLIISFALVLAYKFILRFIFKKTLVNARKYISVFLISLIASVLYIVIVTRAFDFVNNTIFALQTGTIVTFVFWIIDIIKEKVNRNKAGQEQ